MLSGHKTREGEVHRCAKHASKVVCIYSVVSGANSKEAGNDSSPYWMLFCMHTKERILEVGLTDVISFLMYVN